MTAIGKLAWFALMNSKTRTGRAPVSRREPGRRSRENVALQPQLLVLAPQPGQLVTLGCGQAVNLLLPAALLLVGLRNPSADRLRRRLELAGKVVRRAPSTNQTRPSDDGTQAE